MKLYQDALFAINKKATPAAKHNALLKLSTKGDDVEFKALCKAAMNMYGYYLPFTATRTISESRVGKIPRNHMEWRTMMQEAKQALLEYCEAALQGDQDEVSMQLNIEELESVLGILDHTHLWYMVSAHSKLKRQLELLKRL